MSVQFQAKNVSPRSNTAVSRKSKPRRQKQTAVNGQDSGAETDESLNEDASSSSEESDSLSSHSSSQSSARSNGLANSLTLSGEGVVSPATSEGDARSNIAKQASVSSLVSDFDTSTAPSTSTTEKTRQKSTRRSSAISYDQSELPQDPRKAKRVQKDSSTTPAASTSTSASPEEEVDRPHVDLASYPTAHLLHLLAELLQQIASANENLRPAGQNTFSFPSTSSPKSNQAASGSSVLPDTAEITLARTTPFMTPFDINETAAAHAEDYFSSRSVKDSDGDQDMTDAPPTPFSLYQPMPSTSKGYRDSAVLTASKSALKSSSGTLCFHARNVPGIGIEQYLLRILKYCPTTNEVFISLLIYFDRMAQMTQKAACGLLFSTPESTPHKPRPAPRIFAVDAFNIHRLLIAGVTVASKFFSDVFYTNSRYAKVGGLPLHELNQLELQFLLLNDFSLVVPLEEMQRYADGLLLYFKDAQRKPKSEETTPAKQAFRPSAALGHMRSYSGMRSSTSESGSSTVGPRSDCSSVASTGTVRMESSRESSDVEDDADDGDQEDKRME